MRGKRAKPREEPEPYSHDERREKSRRTIKAKEQAFDPYDVKWNLDKTHFEFDAEGMHFYGWWRKIASDLYSVDIFVKRKVGDIEQEFDVDAMKYTGEDPRDIIRALSADITFACTRWYFKHLNGKAEVIDELVKKANKPKIIIRNLATIDGIIMKLREFRDTAIHSGGSRYFEIEGDVRGPTVLIDIDVSRQAMVLEGKPPPLGRGVLYDSTKTGKKSERDKQTESKSPRQQTNIPDSGNVQTLVDMLNKAREKGDVKEQKRLRALLRKIGHSGGARGLGREQSERPAEKKGGERERVKSKRAKK